MLTPSHWVSSRAPLGHAVDVHDERTYGQLKKLLPGPLHRFADQPFDRKPQ